MKNHFPLELYNDEVKRFQCPHCKNTLSIKFFCETTIICKSCENSTELELPKIHKKLVYLDQWLLSDIFLNGKHEKLLEKIKHAVFLRKIFIVISDIHVREIANIPHKEKRELLWKEVNLLNNGIFANTERSANIIQFEKILFKKKESFHWSDIFEQNPHKWNIEIPGLVLISQSLMRLSRIFYPSRQDMNNAFRNILSEKVKHKPLSDSFNSYYIYIKKLWLEDINDGLDFHDRTNYTLNNLTYENTRVLNNNTGRDTYQGIVNPLLKECLSKNDNIDEKEVLEKIKNIQNFNFPRSLDISIAMEANNLTRALQAYSKNENFFRTQKDKKFNPRYGSSKQNDISHVEFAPYIDVMLVDNPMKEEISKEPIRNFFKGLSCEFFSEKEIGNFESWLDQLLEEPEQNGVSATRHLFKLYNKKESDIAFTESLIDLIKKDKDRYINNLGEDKYSAIFSLLEQYRNNLGAKD